MIPLSVPNLTGSEWKYIKECLDTEWVSSAGKFVDLFENKIAEYTGSKYAVACINGTSALQVSLRLAGVQPSDEVIVPTLTFIAPVNAVTYNNATPIFMDVNKYYNLDIDKTFDFINNETVFKKGFSYNIKSKKRISAIIPVHMWGNAVKLDELVDLCSDRNIAIIEDASESLGTVYNKNNFKGKHTGSVGKIGCLSFNGNKIITTGGGGMILTDNARFAEKAKYLTTQAKDDPIRYIHNEIGYNYRITNLQAALGVAQLEKLPNFLKNKKNIYDTYKNEINKINGLSLAEVPSYSNNNHWLNLLRINSKIYSENREDLMMRLTGAKIQTRPVWHLNHLQKPYKNCQTYHIEKALDLVNNSLCIPSSTNLSKQEIKKVINNLNVK